MPKLSILILILNEGKPNIFYIFLAIRRTKFAIRYDEVGELRRVRKVSRANQNEWRQANTSKIPPGRRERDGPN